jgi:ABC-type phosphate transport system substrate-binding protein
MHVPGARRLWFAALGAVWLGFSPLAGQTAASDAEHRDRGDGFVVVVNEQNSIASAPRTLVSQFFLKKATRWESGAIALPVDLPADSPVREAFSRRVLSKSVSSIKAYWQQQIFSGRDVPPPEQKTEAEALEFVRSNAAAIAYVSPVAVLPRGVRVLTMTD